MVTEPVREPHEGIDPFNNAESKAIAAHGAPLVARAGEQGEQPVPESIDDPRHAPGDEQPSLAVPGGTAAGNPLAGLTGGTADAVPGDEGPELPGERRS